jgi:hypothetical protein
MPRVFLVQNPSRRDPDSGEWVPKYDLSAAERFGDIIEMIPPGPDSRETDDLVARLGRFMTGPDGYRPDDYILALGDPIAIAIAVLLGVKNGGGSAVALKHERRHRCYLPVKIEIDLMARAGAASPPLPSTTFKRG